MHKTCSEEKTESILRHSQRQCWARLGKSESFPAKLEFIYTRGFCRLQIMGDSKGESYFIPFRNFKTFDHLLKLAENNLR